MLVLWHGALYNALPDLFFFLPCRLARFIVFNISCNFSAKFSIHWDQSLNWSICTWSVSGVLQFTFFLFLDSVSVILFQLFSVIPSLCYLCFHQYISLGCYVHLVCSFMLVFKTYFFVFVFKTFHWGVMLYLVYSLCWSLKRLCRVLSTFGVFSMLVFKTSCQCVVYIWCVLHGSFQNFCPVCCVYLVHSSW